MKNIPNSNISPSFLLCAVTLHWLILTGLAQPSTVTNQVLSLSGNSAYVTIPNTPSLQPSNAITVEAWIYPEPPTESQHGWYIIKSDAQSIDTQRSYEFDWETNGGNTGVAHPGIEVSFFLNTSTWALLGAPLPYSNWVHVAATFNSVSGLFQLYTNGVLASSTTNATGIGGPLAGQFLRQTDLPLNIGGETLSEGPVCAAAYMDEVRIWNTNRTSIQIEESRFCHLTGTESNLTAYWNFDATNAMDLTGNGNNGTLEGGAVVVPINGPDVVHDGACGPFSHAATAIGVVTNGFIISATITDGGFGYTNTPTVRIIGGGGSGAQAVAVVSNGVVIALNITSAGSGYSSTPLIVIEPPFIPNPVLGIAPMSFLPFSNLTLGGDYQLQQLAEGYYWTNQPVDFAATNSVYEQMVSGVAGSGDYRLALNPVPAQAFAGANVDNGFVVGATITSGGSGYVTSPIVSIVGSDGGTNATATSEISSLGVVTNIVITDAGI